MYRVLFFRAIVVSSCFLALSGGSALRSDPLAAPKPIPVPESLDDAPETRGLRVEHYPASNERRIDLFAPRVANLGGIYIGVGTDQNLTFIAWAKSRYAYLMDFDPVVVGVNKIHLYFISISPTYEEYRNLWSPRNRVTSLELVKTHFADDPDLPILLESWKIAHRPHSGVPERLRELNYMTWKFKFRSFHNVKEDYDYIRTMIAEKRIIAVMGDLTADRSMRSIAEAARSLDLPVRLLYMSNAEEYFRYPEEFRKNILALPTDEKGLIIRTATSGAKKLGYPDGEKYEEIPFHYNIQTIENMKKWMGFRHYLSVLALLYSRTDIMKGFSKLEKTPQQTGLVENGDITKKPKGWW